MEFDDSSEKLRRNLLVFSFAILVSTFLNLGIQKQTTIFSSIDIASVSPLKFWCLITLVLIYLFYRYWFDDKTNQAINLFKTEFNSYRFLYIKQLLNKNIATALLKMNQPKFFTDYKELDESHVVSNNKLHGMPISAVSNANPEFDEQGAWSGKLGNSYSIKWNGDGVYGKSGGNYNRFVIPLLRVYVLRMKILSKIVTYSKSVTELITPILLFVVALCICLYELAHIIFHANFSIGC